jgi:type IV pilus assembly protein PilZ
MQRGKLLTARYPQKEKFLEVFQRRGPAGVLFLESGRKLELSDAVVLLVDFPTEARSFKLHGRVIARRHASRNRELPAGVEVQFAADDAGTLQLILNHAEGKQVDFFPRQGHRLPCAIEIAYRQDADFAREFTEDISEGGTFVQTDRRLPVGTVLECRLKPPGYLLGIKITGRVAWLKETGAGRGMGIEFLFSDDRQRAKIQKLVSRLAARQARAVKKGMERIRQADRSR